MTVNDVIRAVIRARAALRVAQREKVAAIKRENKATEHYHACLALMEKTFPQEEGSIDEATLQRDRLQGGGHPPVPERVRNPDLQRDGTGRHHPDQIAGPASDGHVPGGVH